jgi:cell division protease FtsH
MSDDNRPGGDKEPSGNNWMKSLLIWAGIVLALVLVVQVVGGGASATAGAMPYSDFLTKVDEGAVRSVSIGKETITGRLNDNTTFRTNIVPDPALTQRLAQKGVRFQLVDDESIHHVEVVWPRPA